MVEHCGWFSDFALVGQWFPRSTCWNCRASVAPPRCAGTAEFHFNSEFYADFGLCDVLTVPSDYTVGAVGELQGQPQSEGGRPLPLRAGDVHDFAWVAAKGYKALDGMQGPGSPKVAVRVIYPPEYEASAKPVLKASIDSLGVSRTLGAYPFHRYRCGAAVQRQRSRRHGVPTFFTAEGYSEVDPGTISQYAIDFVTIHEFGHGYFYGLLASNEFEEPMLDEGLNEYWDQRMLRERKQGLDLSTPLMNWLGVTPSMDGFTQEVLPPACASRPIRSARTRGIACPRPATARCIRAPPRRCTTWKSAWART